MGTAKWIPDAPASASVLCRHSTKPLRANVMSWSSACSASLLCAGKQSSLCAMEHGTEGWTQRSELGTLFSIPIFPYGRSKKKKNHQLTLEYQDHFII